MPQNGYVFLKESQIAQRLGAWPLNHRLCYAQITLIYSARYSNKRFITQNYFAFGFKPPLTKPWLSTCFEVLCYIADFSYYFCSNMNYQLKFCLGKNITLWVIILTEKQNGIRSLQSS